MDLSIFNCFYICTYEYDKKEGVDFSAFFPFLIKNDPPQLQYMLIKR